MLQFYRIEQVQGSLWEEFDESFYESPLTLIIGVVGDEWVSEWVILFFFFLIFFWGLGMESGEEINLNIESGGKSGGDG